MIKRVYLNVNGLVTQNIRCAKYGSDSNQFARVFCSKGVFINLKLACCHNNSLYDQQWRMTFLVKIGMFKTAKDNLQTHVLFQKKWMKSLQCLEVFK